MSTLEGMICKKATKACDTGKGILPIEKRLKSRKKAFMSSKPSSFRHTRKTPARMKAYKPLVSTKPQIVCSRCPHLLKKHLREIERDNAASFGVLKLVDQTCECGSNIGMLKTEDINVEMVSEVYE